MIVNLGCEKLVSAANLLSQNLASKFNQVCENLMSVNIVCDNLMSVNLARANLTCTNGMCKLGIANLLNSNFICAKSMSANLGIANFFSSNLARANLPNYIIVLRVSWFKSSLLLRIYNKHKHKH